MAVRCYRVRLRHDHGWVSIYTWARNAKVAARLVCLADRAPLRAVVSVRRLAPSTARRYYL